LKENEYSTMRMVQRKSNGKKEKPDGLVGHN